MRIAFIVNYLFCSKNNISFI